MANASLKPWILGALLGFAAGVAVGGFGVSALLSSYESQRTERDFRRDSRLTTDLASRMNENLPMMIDSETRLDSLVGAGNKLRYIFTVLDPELGVGFDSRVRRQTLSLVCPEETFRRFLRQGLEVDFVYRAPDGSLLRTVQFGADACDGV